MKRKTIWCVISGLMVLSLVLAACAPAVVEKEDEDVTTPTDKDEVVVDEDVQEEEVVEEKEMVTDSLGRLVEKPKYGGWLTLTRTSTPPILDSAVGYGIWHLPAVSTHDAVLIGDWAKGPSGSGEASWVYGLFPDIENLRNQVAESWEIVDETTIVVHIRKGISFHDKPPFGPWSGREMTAYDVAWTIRRMWEQGGGYYSTSYPADIHFEEGLTLEEAITTPDKWTVVIKTNPEKTRQVFEKALVYCSFIYPQDAGEEFGGFMLWENSIGTGPFMLTDMVRDSMIRLERNPNYWDKHPLYPEDTMPYLDGVTILIVPDASTRTAGLRSGKIDYLGARSIGDGALSWEDAASLKKSNPELKYKGMILPSAQGISFRLDRPELPFSDVRVRAALSMAINREEWRDTLGGGTGTLLQYPIAPIPDFMDMYIPLEEYDQEIREIYEYNPDKAKQLLNEAGYPDGFSTQIVLRSDQVDWVAVVKEYWAGINVELKLETKERGAYTSLGTSTPKGFPELYSTGADGYSPWWFGPWAPGGIWNRSVVNDPRLNEWQASINAITWDEAKRHQLYKTELPYIMSQVYYILLPDPETFHFWQPWLKGYNGDYSVGYYSDGNFVNWVWIDQDLKEEMTGIR